MSELRKPLAGRRIDKVAWVKPGPADSVVSFAVLVGPIEARPDDFPRVAERHAILFGAPAGERSVWLAVYRDPSLPPNLADHREKTRATLVAAMNSARVKAMADPIGYSVGFVHEERQPVLHGGRLPA